MCFCCMAFLESSSDTDSAGLSQIHHVNGREKRQFGSSLNFQKSWWSSENWTNCSNATLILCYSKCKLVSQKLFLITLCRVNLLCGNFPCSPLSILLRHEPRWHVWSRHNTRRPLVLTQLVYAAVSLPSAETKQESSFARLGYISRYILMMMQPQHFSDCRVKLV